ncbi:MAG: hypothetical protein A2Z03_09040 [Chloroflexi bacterium RBG_16_56_8]|nr:MAG: hypothetical protein A2Z03_09040 [Chloroflexi bacterium RBG_16_56_8]
MIESDAIRLRHMLDAAQRAMSFAARRSREDLDKDEMLTLSLVKCIEIIGEAATKVSDECQKTNPGIPWDDIIGMRNRLIHAYFDINRDIVWSTITEDLPSLVAELKAVLPDESEQQT